MNLIRIIRGPLLALVALGGCDGQAMEADAGVAAGGGSISGAVGGLDFATVGASYLAGMPDDAARTLVIFVFQGVVGCGLPTHGGWDAKLAEGEQVLEIKLVGKTPGTYPVSRRPSAGEADVNHTVGSATSAAIEVSATGGEVVLDEVVDGISASGRFTLEFPNGSLSGTFSAAFCAEAREP